uniref:Uncharacterized protein n=1 Tax=Anguilla anguilla TaxID=7936 RepID=A0A0E9XP16_ANGAN
MAPRETDEWKQEECGRSSKGSQLLTCDPQTEERKLHVP